jgi:hypothetical protein
MNEVVRDCLVTGYEDSIESLSLPDPDDRAVLAAAIRVERSGWFSRTPLACPLHPKG